LKTRGRLALVEARDGAQRGTAPLLLQTLLLLDFVEGQVLKSSDENNGIHPVVKWVWINTY
jgi:hypothetical protein